MQNQDHNVDPPEPESVFEQNPQVILCTLTFEKNLPSLFESAFSIICILN